MEIKLLDSVSEENILEIFNRSFANYFVPFQLTPKQLKLKMTSDKVNLSYSVGTFENEKLIAFILHGFDIINDKKVIYNTGTGVILASRGQGLTKKSMNIFFPN